MPSNEELFELLVEAYDAGCWRYNRHDGWNECRYCGVRDDSPHTDWCSFLKIEQIVNSPRDILMTHESNIKEEIV